MVAKFDRRTCEIMERELSDNSQAPNSIRHSLFVGETTHVIYGRILNSPVFNFSKQARYVAALAKDTIIIGVTYNNGYPGSAEFTSAANDDTATGRLDYQPAAFKIFDLNELMNGRTYVRIPELALIIGYDQNELAELNIFNSEIHPHGLTLKENAIGMVLAAVVENEDSRIGNKLFVNMMGKTYSISCQPTTVGHPPGLYYTAAGKMERMGEIDDFIFKDDKSLENDLILYTNKTEAEKYRTIKSIIDHKVNIGKMEILKMEQDVVKAKARTSIADNEAKVNTIKVKEGYETNSIARKDASEDTSFGRSAILGTAALVTAGLTVFAKMGFSPSAAAIAVASITPIKSVAKLALAVLFGSALSPVVEKLWGAVKVVGGVIVSAVSTIASGVSYLCRGAYNLGRSIIGGIRSLFW